MLQYWIVILAVFLLPSRPDASWNYASTHISRLTRRLAGVPLCNVFRFDRHLARAAKKNFVAVAFGSNIKAHKSHMLCVAVKIDSCIQTVEGFSRKLCCHTFYAWKFPQKPSEANVEFYFSILQASLQPFTCGVSDRRCLGGNRFSPQFAFCQTTISTHIRNRIKFRKFLRARFIGKVE